MKKICILSTVNLKHMTLVSLYTEFLDKNNISYDLIYIDKYNAKENNNARNVYKYDLNIKQKWPFFRKLISYWAFKKFAKKILLKNKYDFIITWNIFTAFMFSNILKKHFNKKYCLNIRDIYFQDNPIVKFKLKTAVYSSAFSTLSSEGFKRYLPAFDYVIIHSMNMKVLADSAPHTKLKGTEGPINITYIGYMSLYDNCYKLIDYLGNDSRFKLNFYGQGSELIVNYAKEKKINNVFCSGRFEPYETAGLIQDADIIYNLYGVGEVNLDTALSIKLYYATYLNVPILVFKNTYMEEISCKYGFGYAIEKDGFNNLGNNLYKWYRKLNQDEIHDNCEEFKKVILKSHRKLELLMNKLFIEEE